MDAASSAGAAANDTFNYCEQHEDGKQMRLTRIELIPRTTVQSRESESGQLKCDEATYLLTHPTSQLVGKRVHSYELPTNNRTSSGEKRLKMLEVVRCLHPLKSIELENFKESIEQHV